jgi:hypothetical protein
MGTMGSLFERQSGRERVKEKGKLGRALGRRLYSAKFANPPSGARMGASSASGEGVHTPWGDGALVPNLLPIQSAALHSPAAASSSGEPGHAGPHQTRPCQIPISHMHDGSRHRGSLAR